MHTEYCEVGFLLFVKHFVVICTLVGGPACMFL